MPEDTNPSSQGKELPSSDDLIRAAQENLGDPALASPTPAINDPPRIDADQEIDAPPRKAEAPEMVPSQDGSAKGHPPPGWYHAETDPAATERYWDGLKWVGEPRQARPPPPVVSASSSDDAARLRHDSDASTGGAAAQEAREVRDRVVQETWWRKLWDMKYLRWGIPAAVFVIAGFIANSTPVDDLERGDCFDIPVAVVIVDDIDAKPCSESHDAELIAKFDIDIDSGEYPSDAALVEAAIRQCFDEFLDYTGVAMGKMDLGPQTFVPSREAWEDGGRTAACAAIRVSAFGAPVAVTGSLRTESAVEPPASMISIDIDEVDSVTSTQTLIADLIAGQCVGRPGLTSDFQEVVDCIEPHGGEVYAVSQVQVPGDGYPGDAEMVTIVEQGCLSEFESYVGTAYAQSRLFFDFYYPNEQGWRSGYYTSQCLLFATDFGGRIVAITGTSRDSHR